MTAQYSCPYIVGAPLAYGPARYDAYGEAYLDDPAVRSVADKVRFEISEDIERKYYQSSSRPAREFALPTAPRDPASWRIASERRESGCRGSKSSRRRTDSRRKAGCSRGHARRRDMGWQGCTRACACPDRRYLNKGE
ncbi:hypothetical protein [Burkholderia sp. 8Y]|uniref:hypothetical protein n=1 Tax=Burkholderia sp. 8Y TaxID=2653133 RepID=UPI002E2E402C|nr:hypothetical protein [Burkholderia sp. 8Y]